MQYSQTESRILQICCLTCLFQFDVISKRIKLETWDCAQMKGLSSIYRMVASYDLSHGYLGRQIPKTMGCVFFFNSRSKITDLCLISDSFQTLQQRVSPSVSLFARR